MSGTVRSTSEIAAMRESGRILATVLELLKKKARPGVTPKDMSALARRELARLGGAPAFHGYQGFPDIICISVNDQVQHSIPNARPFQAGDVVNFDFGVTYKGMITDGGISVGIGGKVDANSQRLLKGTEEALYRAIDAVRDGVHVGNISAVIQDTLESYKLGIVRELVGHGVGHHLHEDPEIPNYGLAGQGPILKAGMTVAIEPITTLGSEAIMMESDGWTLRTVDGSRSAQFEHTILVTATGAEILTQV